MHYITFPAKNERTPNTPIMPTTDPVDHLAPEFEIGTDKPIVRFRQLSSVVSIPIGSGVSGAFVSLLNAPELLYPSRVRTTLLAR